MKKTLVFLFSIFYFLFSHHALASEMRLLVRPISDLYSDFEAVLILDTEDESINALEGDLVYPSDLIKVSKVNDGNSIINLWLSRPHLDESTGRIHFEGIVPGGYTGSKGLIFSAAFESIKKGDGIIELVNVKVLLNDGAGTPAVVKKSFAHFDALLDAVGTARSFEEDKIPPEDFTAVVVQDPSVYDNQWFLVFETQDKGSGIDHYEVSEGGKFLSAVSPYLLKNQSLNKDIAVKAFDKSGNIREITVPAKNPDTWPKVLILAIILVSLILLRVLQPKIQKHLGKTK